MFQLAYLQSLVGKGLKAGEWVNEVSGLLNAKGGGRDESAQCCGSAVDKVEIILLPSHFQVKDALDVAKGFAALKLGSS